MSLYVFFLLPAPLWAAPQKLKTQMFKVCGENIHLEIAKSDSERAKGLMEREGLAQKSGMVFIFESEQPLAFWMKNVPFDIDIGFFDGKGKLVSSMTMLGTSPLTQEEFLPRYPSGKSAKFAVEVPKDFFKTKSSTTCHLSPLPK